jgi:mevalonate kinase
MKGNKIPAKLLLAGEFTVLTGGEALGIPFPKFHGQWAFDQKVDHRLEKLFHYLISKNIDFLNLDQLSKDIREGLVFQSNIPEAYGLGGSGALSAAMLHRYSMIQVDDLKIIQQQLALIESLFHGTSSGFDPLISYTRQGCLIQNNDTRVLTNTEVIYEKLGSNLYLIDSNTDRKTIIPIQWFYEQLKSGDFKVSLSELNEMNSLFIRSVLDTDQHDLSSTFQRISVLQFDLFKPLIVPSMNKIWKTGLDQGTHFCKLCGKGGGGFYYIWLNERDLPVLNQDYTDLRFVSIH